MHQNRSYNRKHPTFDLSALDEAGLKRKIKWLRKKIKVDAELAAAKEARIFKLEQELDEVKKQSAQSIAVSSTVENLMTELSAARQELENIKSGESAHATDLNSAEKLRQELKGIRQKLAEYSDREEKEKRIRNAQIKKIEREIGDLERKLWGGFGGHAAGDLRRIATSDMAHPEARARAA